jgi:UDP-2,3-diacylglucosamine pyrophosphatase LpxH
MLSDTKSHLLAQMRVIKRAVEDLSAENLFQVGDFVTWKVLTSEQPPFPMMVVATFEPTQVFVEELKRFSQFEVVDTELVGFNDGIVTSTFAHSSRLKRFSPDEAAMIIDTTIDSDHDPEEVSH